MIFDLESRQEGEWFKFFESRINEKGEVEYDDPKPDAGRFCIRSIGPVMEEIRSAKKKRFEFVLNPSTRSMERVGYLPDQTPAEARAEMEQVWDYAITGIEDAFDGKGNALACTKENKIKLMAVPMFDRFVARCLQLLSAAGVKAKEEASKN
jgi:hypothetical protein